jgi:hypothetical protein
MAVERAVSAVPLRLHFGDEYGCNRWVAQIFFSQAQRHSYAVKLLLSSC